MDDKTYFSAKAEARAVYELTKARYHVFSQISGKAPFDLVASKGAQLLRISVKSTNVRGSDGSYPVQIKKVRPNKSTNTIVHFDPTECDVLAVYINELDLVCWIPAADVKSTCMISLATTPSKYAKSRLLIADFPITVLGDVAEPV